MNEDERSTETTVAHDDGTTRRGRLEEVCLLFLKLGALGFGGPAAHVALMEEEVVRRRRWMPRQEFLDLLAAANLLPGPNSTELALFLGRARAGWSGLVAAGVCFILPSALLVAAIAAAYVRLGTLPAAAGVLYAVKPVVIATLLQALWTLAPTALKSARLAALAGAAAVAAALGAAPLAILAGAALLGAVFHGRSPGSADRSGSSGSPASPGSPGSSTSSGPPLSPAKSVATLPLAASAPARLPPGLARLVAAALTAPFGLWPLFLVFLKTGAVLFGSGYVLLAFLRQDLVERLGWLSERQLLDAVAVGQITPGPVFTTATFIGYVLGGGPGALVATVAIFLPAFLYAAAAGPLILRLRRAPRAAALIASLDAVVAASLALLAVVACQLARAALVDAATVVIAAVAAVALLRFRLESAWLLAAAAALGAIFGAAAG